ncbi:Uncharacterised protein r2_g553 [Pycnogonum litorale]
MGGEINRFHVKVKCTMWCLNIHPNSVIREDYDSFVECTGDPRSTSQLTMACEIGINYENKYCLMIDYKILVIFKSLFVNNFRCICRNFFVCNSFPLISQNKYEAITTTHLWCERNGSDRRYRPAF